MPALGSCSSCGARIYWVSTPNGKKMPVDADLFWLRPRIGGDTSSVSGTGTIIVGDRLANPAPGAKFVGTSHFATCPNANSHRRG